MEPRTNVPKTSQSYPEEPTRRSESRLNSRFSIEPLEERIAPDKGGNSDHLRGGSGSPNPTGF